MPAGYSGTPLVKKLGIKPGQTVLLVRAPEGFEELLDGLPERVRILRERGGDVQNRLREGDRGLELQYGSEAGKVGLTLLGLMSLAETKPQEGWSPVRPDRRASR